MPVVYIDIRTKKPYIAFVNTNQFLRKVRRAGRNNGVAVSFDPKRGKGSHGTLHYGDRRTVVPRSKDLGPGLIAAMLAQIGLTLDDI